MGGSGLIHLPPCKDRWWALVNTKYTSSSDKMGEGGGLVLDQLSNCQLLKIIFCSLQLVRIFNDVGSTAEFTQRQLRRKYYQLCMMRWGKEKTQMSHHSWQPKIRRQQLWNANNKQILPSVLHCTSNCTLANPPPTRICPTCVSIIRVKISKNN